MGVARNLWRVDTPLVLQITGTVGKRTIFVGKKYGLEKKE